jgi:DNA-binding MarR family transcriptional regulator
VPEEKEPRWLEACEQATWLAVAGLMTRLPYVLDAQLQRDSGLTLFEYFVLSHLSMAEGRTMRMSGLAYLVNGSQSRLSNVVKRLEERGLARREPSPENGRHINAILTDEGFEVVRQAAPGHVEAVRHYLFDAITPDQAEQLHEIGDRIVERTDPLDMFPRLGRTPARGAHRG